ncbi:glucose-6-phosphate dehydrogenase [Elsinoe australis]|uniref:Glucose-6-phosphate dehydrogenase n=1 Tax=Elsinoe australis TaxID=40998 RepID=A0A2P7YN02_9PEZI|nr:glucose-6-phosphate dehydrogenase [Elsinoe australis]
MSDIEQLPIEVANPVTFCRWWNAPGSSHEQGYHVLYRINDNESSCCDYFHSDQVLHHLIYTDDDHFHQYHEDYDDYHNHTANLLFQCCPINGIRYLCHSLLLGSLIHCYTYNDPDLLFYSDCYYDHTRDYISKYNHGCIRVRKHYHHHSLHINRCANRNFVCRRGSQPAWRIGRSYGDKETRRSADYPSISYQPASQLRNKRLLLLDWIRRSSRRNSDEYVESAGQYCNLRSQSRSAGVVISTSTLSTTTTSTETITITSTDTTYLPNPTTTFTVTSIDYTDSAILGPSITKSAAVSSTVILNGGFSKAKYYSTTTYRLQPNLVNIAGSSVLDTCQ